MTQLSRLSSHLSLRTLKHGKSRLILGPPSEKFAIRSYTAHQTHAAALRGFIDCFLAVRVSKACLSTSYFLDQRDDEQ